MVLDFQENPVLAILAVGLGTGYFRSFNFGGASEGIESFSDWASVPLSR